MNFNVMGKCATVTEWLITERTIIRLFPCMYSQMYSQIGFSFEAFPTSCALIWPLIWMNFNVMGKCTPVTEWFVTQWAHKRLLTGMNSQMSSQISFSTESFPTSKACMRSILWIGFHMEHSKNIFPNLDKNCQTLNQCTAKLNSTTSNIRWKVIMQMLSSCNKIHKHLCCYLFCWHLLVSLIE